MIQDTWYQAKPDAYTALLLARVRPDGPPDYVLPHFGQDAYENYGASLYLRELFRALDGEPQGWPGFTYLYAATRVLLEQHDRVTFVELGSTLFATIDKLRQCERRFGGFRMDGRLGFTGIEISEFFNRIAAALHPADAITFFADHRDLDSASLVTVGRSYQASSYAFTSTSEFVDWVARLTFSVQGAWFTTTGGDRTIDAMGKRLTLFEYNEFVDGLLDRGVRVHHIESERYTLREHDFIASWLVTERLDERALDAFSRICLADARLNGPGLVTGPSQLNSSQPSAVREAGPHSNAIDPDQSRVPLGFPVTFDFGSRGLEARFREHIAAVHPDRVRRVTP